MDIYVFSDDGALLGLVDDPARITSVLRYAEAGELTVVCPNSDANRALLKVGRILGLRQARRLSGESARLLAGRYDGFLLERVKLEADGQKEWLTATAQGLSALLRQRVIPARWSVSGDAASAIDAIVTAHCVSPSDGARAIPGMRTAGGFTSAAVAREGGRETVYDGVRALANLAGTGFAVDFLPASGGLVFRQYAGIDRADDPFGSFLLLDERFGNLLETSYLLDRNDWRTTAYVAGKETDDGGLVETVNPDARGLARREVFVNGSDLRITKDADGQQVPLTETEYRELLRARGLEKLRERTIEERMGAKVNPAAGLVFRRDYDLGDRVRVRSARFGIETALPVTAVTEYREGDTETVTPTLGDELPQIVRRLSHTVQNSF